MFVCCFQNPRYSTEILQIQEYVNQISQTDFYAHQTSMYAETIWSFELSYGTCSCTAQHPDHFPLGPGMVFGPWPGQGLCQHIFFPLLRVYDRFMRMNVNQLRRIKSCMFQAALTNDGVRQCSSPCQCFFEWIVFAAVVLNFIVLALWHSEFG